jgi:hypothetical protein
MATRWNRIALALAVTAMGAACGSREETVVELREAPAAATHGGQVIVLEDDGPRVEIVHEVSTGTVFLYPLKTEDRVLVFEQAPVIEVHTADGTVPVTFTRVEGDVLVWRATHDAFRRSDLSDVRLVARADGRRFEETVALRADASAEPVTPATPASLPPEGEAPAPSDMPSDMDEAAPPAPATPDAPSDLEGTGEPAAPAPPPTDPPPTTPPASEVEAPPSRRGEAPVEPTPSEAMPPSEPSEPAAPVTPPADGAADPADPAAADAGAKAAATEREIHLSGGATVRTQLDAKTGRLSLRILDADGKPIDAESVTVVLPSEDGAAPKEITFTRPEAGIDAAWMSSDAALRAPKDARLVVTIDGKRQEAAFVGLEAGDPEPGDRMDETAGRDAEPVTTPPSEERPAPPPQDDAQRQEIPAAAPADEPPPRDNRPAPKAGTDSTGDGKTDKPKPDEVPDLDPTDAPGTSNRPADTMENEARMALEGSHLLAVPGLEGVRLEVLHDKNVGKLSVQAIRGDVAVALDEAPVLYAATEEGPQKATLTRLEGKPVWWILHTGLKGRDAVGRVRLSIAGKVYDVDLLGEPLPAADVTTETVLLGDREYVVERDSGTASIYLRGLGVDDLRMLVRSADGRFLPVGFVAVPGRPNTFRFTHDAFRNPRFEGTVTGRLGARTVEGRLAPRGAAPSPAGNNTGGAGTTSSGTTTSGTTGSGTTTSGTTTSGTTTSGQTSSGTTTSGTTGGAGEGSGAAGSGAGGSSAGGGR